ncbi:MAG: hypothetical protein K0S41_2529 [Anaerocolumna sp.]|jgi:hypothetical protein|nr:hypothetical protein [Anaerocolumna sp.]
MFFFILFALLCAKLKGYRIKPILKAYSLYPFVVIQVLYLFLQVNVFLGNYNYIKYASIFKSVYLYTLILPLFVYKLYKSSLYGSAFIIIGTILNRFVMHQNGGKMPVFASLSKFTGYYNESAILTLDNIHIIGDDTTKYKFLTDFIDVGYSVLSIGDLFIHSFAFIVIYNVIKAINNSLDYTIDIRKENLYGDT